MTDTLTEKLDCGCITRWDGAGNWTDSGCGHHMPHHSGEGSEPSTAWDTLTRLLHEPRPKATPVLDPDGNTTGRYTVQLTLTVDATSADEALTNAMQFRDATVGGLHPNAEPPLDLSFDWHLDTPEGC